jgi:FSR family fosmidomycin resistance protein-like MFS transporter
MEYKKLSLKNISTNLLVYGTTHAVVDGICVAVIFSVFRNQIVGTDSIIGLVILYNALAFGLQAIFGLATDYLKSPRAVAFLGCILTGLSAITFLSFPIIAVIFAGLGNALFHIGGGSISLNLTPKKAAAPGIFVAPGALGLFAGALLAKNGQFIVWPAILILAVLCVVMFLIKKPEMDYKKEEIIESKFNYFEFILLFVLLSIAIRSLVGSALVFPWKTNFDLLIILTAGVVLGKGLGGILADKFGWIKIAVGALAVSIPLLVFGSNIPSVAIIGMFLFNITMPITLVVISNILPGRPGFAFGLTTLALIIGTFPTYTGLKIFLGTQWFIFIIIIISTLSLYYGLQRYLLNYEQKKLVD